MTTWSAGTVEMVGQPGPGQVVPLPLSPEREYSSHWEEGLAVGPDAKACHRDDGYVVVTFVPHSAHVTYLVSLTLSTGERDVSRPTMFLLQDSIAACTARPVDPATLAALFAAHGDAALRLLEESPAKLDINTTGKDPAPTVALADVIAAVTAALTPSH